jgi:transcriptional regulator with XRE-family HTH domain
MEIILPFIIKSPQEVSAEIASKVRARRLAANLTQLQLAQRSGVTLASLKRFERTGNISLQSLLLLAVPLGCLDSFSELLPEQGLHGMAMADLFQSKPKRKRARGK